MPTSYAPINSANNAAAIAAQLTPQQLWQAKIDKFEENGDFWQTWEGGQTSPIVVKKDLSAGKGHDMIIRVESGFSYEPKYGEDTFDEDTDFEADKFNEYHLKIGVIRHAASGTELAEEANGLRGLLLDKHPEKVGDWLGRMKTEQLDMLLRETVNESNVMYAGQKTKDTLAKADGLSFNLVSTGASLLSRLGGAPAKVGTMNGAAAMRYTLVSENNALTILRQDSDYKTLVQQAASQGKMNPSFTGEVVDLDGIAVVKRNVIDMDYDGALGSPMAPRARLGTAIAAGTTAIDVTGGAATNIFYFKYFEGFAYKWSDGTTYSPPSETKYFLIINPPNYVAAPNKIGMYSYTTGNNGNKITIVNRLGSAASGARVTTLGDVVWDTGVWAGKHTDVHPAGALIVPCNRKGEPLGCSFLLGQAAILRGYGKYRNKMGRETEEDGFMTKTFVRSYFGQTIRRDRIGRQPGVLKIVHSLHYPDLPLPAVV